MSVKIVFLFQIYLIIGGLGLAAYGATYSVVVIEPGHQGIVYSRISGLNKSRRLTEGMNILIPYFERSVIYDIRARPQQITTQSGSKGWLNDLMDPSIFADIFSHT